MTREVALAGIERMLPAYASLTGAIPEPWLARLREEARALRTAASKRERKAFELSEGRLLCALRNWYAGDGTIDKDVDGRRQLASRLEQWSGTRLRATHSSYLYYAQGDFLGLHRDHVSCAITALVWLSGPAGPLGVHPDLYGLDDEALLGIARASGGHPAGGVEIDIRDGPIVLPGHVVPHDRPPHMDAEELAIATFCFGIAAPDTGSL
jgi:hypothetical protein